jgi:hypothetical protein
MTKGTPKNILPQISKPDESRSQSTKTLLKEYACDFIVYITPKDYEIKCGKPAVEKVQGVSRTSWLCPKHFEEVSLFRSLMKEQ